MKCEWDAKLDRYVDAELPDAELTEVEAHLRGCPNCAMEALSRLQLKRMTQAVGCRFSPRPEFRLKIEQSIRPAKRPRWTWPWVQSFAAAAALALLLISAALWLQRPRGELLLGELADLHVSTLASANPIDVVSSDRHTVKPWFQGKLPFAFDLPELQDSPFKLAGGRLTYFRQSPAAQLLVEVRKHRISVFIFLDRGELSRVSSGFSETGKPPFNTATWTKGGLRYFIIGDAGLSDIQSLSELLKGAARS